MFLILKKKTETPDADTPNMWILPTDIRVVVMIITIFTMRTDCSCLQIVKEINPHVGQRKTIWVAYMFVTMIQHALHHIFSFVMTA